MKPDKIYLSLVLLIILTTISWMTSCTHKANIADIPEICFEGDVLPIFTTSCAISGCHDGQGESDLVLNNYLDISHSVVPGNPYSSKVYKAIIATTGENKMPPDQPLSLENRTKIRLWIEQGAGLTLCPEITGNGGGDGGSSYVNPRSCFTRDILPVLVSRCAVTDCHNAVTHKGDYIFASYTTTMKAVKPGIPGESKLYKVIKLSTGEDKMPPAGSFSSCRIRQFEIWVNNGFLNN